jgi:hypothetical protein
VDAGPAPVARQVLAASRSWSARPSLPRRPKKGSDRLNFYCPRCVTCRCRGNSVSSSLSGFAAYVSPKLSNIAVVKDVREMTDAELDWAIRDAQQGPRPREGFRPQLIKGGR